MRDFDKAPIYFGRPPSAVGYWPTANLSMDNIFLNNWGPAGEELVADQSWVGLRGMIREVMIPFLPEYDY